VGLTIQKRVVGFNSLHRAVTDIGNKFKTKGREPIYQQIYCIYLSSFNATGIASQLLNNKEISDWGL